MVEIETDLRIHEGAEGPLLTVISLGNPEDRKFLLSPTSDETCNRDLEQLEPC